MNKSTSWIFLFLFFSELSFAGCIKGPTYSTHKVEHSIGTAAISGVVTVATNDPWKGFASGLAVGATRELYKIKTPGMRCEWSSMAYDIVGSASGAYLAHWYIQPVKGGVYIAWHKEF